MIINDANYLEVKDFITDRFGKSLQIVQDYFTKILNLNNCEDTVSSLTGFQERQEKPMVNFFLSLR